MVIPVGRAVGYEQQLGNARENGQVDETRPSVSTDIARDCVGGPGPEMD